MADDVTPVEASVPTTARRASGAPREAGRTPRRSGLREAGFQAPAPGGTNEPARGHLRRIPRVGISVTAPLVSASVEIPGRGASAKVGPARIDLPAGAVVVAGAAAMAVAASVELPLVLGALAAGLLLGRNRVQGLLPRVSLFDAAPEARR
jgi:hypothetical protein